MNRMRIIIGESIVDYYQSTGNIIVETYIMHDDFAFPMLNWTVFSVSLLCTWSEAIITRFESRQPIELYFMDGPYRFTINNCGKDLVIAYYHMHDENHPKILECRISELLEALLNATKDLLTALRLNGNLLNAEHDLLRYQERLISFREKIGA